MRNTTLALLALSVAAASSVLPAQAYQRTSVHDPSIVVDTITDPARETFYIFGSHMGVSRSTDLLNWTSNICGGQSPNATLFGRRNADGSVSPCSYTQAFVTPEVKRVKALVGGEVQEVDFPALNAYDWRQSLGGNINGNLWAPDVIYNPTMGKWLLYMSLNADYWQSVIVCMAADKVEGPYVYQGPVCYSGFGVQGKGLGYKQTDLELVLGNQASLPARYSKPASGSGNWGEFWPNNIDPCVFYDDEGVLWMSYGSWSGGIFMLQLDPTTGLRDYTVAYPDRQASTRDCTSDPYFGTKIAGGYYVSGEGSYIKKIGDWYYLWMSYGGLTSDGGYEMRVFRSARPDGPYRDCSTDAGVSALFNSYRLNYGTNATDNRGVKMMGAYKWPTMDLPQIAQGHNSVTTDREGRSFVIYHTRFVDGNEGHQVRVHQLFTNLDGWLVTTPYEFKGETVTQHDIDTRQMFTADDVAGTYQIIRHPYRQNHAAQDYAVPTVFTLNADGTVTGPATTPTNSSWSLVEGTSHIELKINYVTYKGVLCEQMLEGSARTALTISALSSSSGTAGSSRAQMLWGSKVDADIAQGTVVGQEDNSTSWWSAFSEYYIIEPDQRLHLEFTNYTNGAANWNNWLAVVTSDAERGATGYQEYIVLRSDAYGWQGSLNTASGTWFDALTHNYDWNTFTTDMDGADVALDITREGGKLTLRADVTTAAGKELYEEFVMTAGNADKTFRAFLTVEGGHLVIDDAASTITPSGIDDIGTDRPDRAPVIFDLAGRRVAQPGRGLYVIDGRKVLLR